MSSKIQFFSLKKQQELGRGFLGQRRYWGACSIQGRRPCLELRNRLGAFSNQPLCLGWLGPNMIQTEAMLDKDDKGSDDQP